MTGSNETRTPEEQALIDRVAETRGREFAEENAELIIAQAELIGAI